MYVAPIKLKDMFVVAGPHLEPLNDMIVFGHKRTQIRCAVQTHRACKTMCETQIPQPLETYVCRIDKQSNRACTYDVDKQQADEPSHDSARASIPV